MGTDGRYLYHLLADLVCYSGITLVSLLVHRQHRRHDAVEIVSVFSQRASIGLDSSRNMCQYAVVLQDVVNVISY